MDNAIHYRTAASDEKEIISFPMYYGKGIMNIQIENNIKDTPKSAEWNLSDNEKKRRKRRTWNGIYKILKLVVKNIMVRWRSAIRRKSPFK